MSEPTIINEDAAHKKFAVDCFNKIWTLLQKENRTTEENEMMIHLAHTSLFHWLHVGTALHEQRGAWMLAWVYTILEDKTKALHHAKCCLALTEKNDFKDFDLAYAYESMARACALNAMNSESNHSLSRAKEAGEKIAENDDRDLFMNDLESEPWFGVK